MNSPVRKLTLDHHRELTDSEFKMYQEFMHKEAGIALNDSKRALLAGRLTRRLRELNLTKFGDYFEYATDPRRPDEKQLLIDAICTNETNFFREPRHFAFLETVAFPLWRETAVQQRGKLRVWSAASSTGEEPYSLAMLLHSSFADSGVEFDISASDLSTKVLKRARDAEWPLDKTKSIPQLFLKRYMLRGFASQEGRVRASEELRSLVRFFQFNLKTGSYPAGPFDAIFLRNVLIYFDGPLRAQVLDRMASLLAPNGFLFLGHAESVLHATERLCCVEPTIYCLPENPMATPRRMRLRR